MRISRDQMREWKWQDILLIGLAPTLQILVTLPMGDTQIRIAAADLLLPLMLALLFLKFRQNGTGFVQWRVRRVWAWLLVLTSWLSISLVQGILFIGNVQTWALVSKYFGWYVLMAFFLVGGLSANNVSPGVGKLFFWLLFLFACTLGLVDVLPYIETMRGFGHYNRLEGFSDNPNGYGFLVAIVTVVLLARQSRGVIVSGAFDMAGTGLLLSLVALSGSRSAWLGLFCGVVCLIMAGRIRFVHLLAVTIIATSLVIVINSAHPIERSIRHFIAGGADQPVGSVSPPAPYLARGDMLGNDSGVAHRIEIFHSAIDLWRQKPIVGVGLGGYLWSELKDGRTAVIHTTALWLLTETGLIGLCLFAGFLADMMWQLWKQRGKDDDDGMIVGGIAMLAVFAGASIGTEVMYQRHVWLFAGWALASAASARRPGLLSSGT